MFVAGLVRHDTGEELAPEKTAQEDESDQLTGDRQRSALHKHIQESRKTTAIDQNRKKKIIIRKRRKRKETCERYLDQILIRGEQIVSVRLA